MLGYLEEVPPDPIMGAGPEWTELQRTYEGEAINTTVGVLLDPETGSIWRPDVVNMAACEALFDSISQHNYGYQTQAGHPEELSRLADLVFGEDLHESVKGDLIAIQTSGGTGALNRTSDILAHANPYKPEKRLMVFDAGWPNYQGIFSEKLSIFSPERTTDQQVNHEVFMAMLQRTPEASVVLLQACGYNDDGLDRTPEQWDEVFDYLAERDIEVIIDAAYIGLADGYRTDCYPIEQAIKKGLTTFVCVSASKNMGLYGERVGALYIANAGRCNGSEKQQRLKMILDHQITRPTISSPSRMFAQAVAIMLGNNSSRNTYLDELESARNRLQQNREALAESLDDRFPHVTQGKGIFTQIFSEGFTQAEREQLRAEGILALPNSRVNIGGMRTEHVQRVGSAILGVLKNR